MTAPDSKAPPTSSPAQTIGGSSGAPVSAHTSDSTAVSANPRLRPPRSLPPWIDSYEQRYGEVSVEQLRLLQPPTRIVQRQSNFAPSETQRRVSKDGFVGWDDPQLGPAQEARSSIPHFLRYGRASMRGRKWDHLRSAEPVIISNYRPAPPQGPMSWRDFIYSSSWGRRMNEESQIIDYETLNKLQPTFNSDIKVQFHHTDGRAKYNRKTIALSKRIWNGVMRHPLSPFLFRLGVMVTSILALGISARIYKLEGNTIKVSAERTKSVVAIVVDCLAIPYIGYMIWDEYTGKPLGLRSAISKISLILLDLFFIIFKSASTALAFESFIYHNGGQSTIIHLSMALAAFQLLGLVSWSMTFTINIFRMVKQLGGNRDDNDDSKV
ncbi:hypothetical protein QQS21_012214 [Conoideocrella luteorostrata]|uniref:Uncharacterized protein n=1 Tax=Conoideocrella luteorostrata TaxID=1105319 RepID=A0AAJ0CEC6_9HYPO|nr:hypothetical protein QQS21_012214 [Conoideocrella luteorostrata]